ncbi:lysylphosphatidylglycerol synthase transmembrane domain-containing protein [Sinorhizobium sp. BG8]|uniref:lysylphosphatidylglycerol synthase transmembrane domain-containing protein n=1 Tax=Sinorhizobium sp. BG8 TaxID=2613773 RepID=UPI00193E5621|nr:lysylphosphatidylglycerol synthase transmembrane domain-containing protein [Sinorhizobium sp. BG8]QRM56083.1 flippase-like domain-containing protein [Sinorhizobium sp. BG8]
MRDQSGWSSASFANILRVTLGLVAGVTFIYLVMRNVHIAEVGTLLADAAIAPLVIAILAYVADFLLRAARFWAMLLATTGRRIPLRPTIGPFIASFGVSDVLPLRVGDGFRVLWFNRQFGIPAGTVIGTMIVERILDLVTIVILGGISLAFVVSSAPPALVWNFQLVLGIAIAGGLVLLFAPALLCRVMDRLFGHIKLAPVVMVISALHATSEAVIKIGSWHRVVWLTALSLALWLLESVVLIGAWVSLGGSLDELLKPFLAFVFSTLGTLVPSLPGHFGSFEFFGIQAFALSGVDTTTAAAVILLAHIILWAPTALFGILWLLAGAASKVHHTA